MKLSECSGRTLAFLGDAAWSLTVRRKLIESGNGKGSVLQKKTIRYVSANAQASFYDALHAKGFFTEEEEEIFRRGRNDNAGTVPKSASVADYRKATGFEAVIGMLELTNNRNRSETIWEQVNETGEAA